MLKNIIQKDRTPSDSSKVNDNRLRNKHFRIIILLVIAIFLFSAFDVRLKIVEYTITSNKITNPIRIALVTIYTPANTEKIRKL